MKKENELLRSQVQELTFELDKVSRVLDTVKQSHDSLVQQSHAIITVMKQQHATSQQDIAQLEEELRREKLRNKFNDLISLNTSTNNCDMLNSTVEN